ncbi:hypothetical protein CDL12_03351 [Handroanthus impetiginosus]|uniref:Iron-related transcription factor 3 bHLH domain-containing protein n=1 Tax=Handroanthus impetiginosus TaxID=429701 RepID=A0A2G9I2F3_9LAMI|nr:hypothetical protein CDL12_03351 [Handroanthus impetiginosus]
MKRERMNELFLALENSLELSDQSNGKAFILIEATRMMKDMLAQIECLRKENSALLSESQYVTVENDELKDENSALEDQIWKLETQLNSRASESQLDLNIVPPDSDNQELPMISTDGCLMFPCTQPGQPQGPIVNPLHLTAFCSDMHAYPKFGTEQITSNNISIVSKPHARYPTPTDRWPSQVLENKPELGQQVQHG